MKKQEPYRRKSKITIPDHCHPMAKMVFALMRDHGVTYDELEWKSGVLRSTFKAWRTCNLPSIPTIEAALGVFGYSVLPIPPANALPAGLREDLEAVAEKHGLEAVPHVELISSCIGYRHHEHTHFDARERRAA